MGRPHRTLFQPTEAGTVARFVFLPERAEAVKPDCAIRHADNGITAISER
ncbi:MULTISPECIES: hypothetical protein [unclassified Rhizobium]|nr:MULTISPECIES: hypothetical protein [unclassified Rhizobium]